MTRGCLLAIAIVVAFWIAFGLFVAAAIAAPRREAEPVPRPSSGASHVGAVTYGRTALRGLVPGPSSDAPLPLAADLESSPSTASSVASVTGRATWYRYHPGQAAAGPRLRAWLGKGWRGQSVVVTANGRSVVVRLSDYCGCPGRIVDLDRASFAALAPTSTGVLRVTVSRLPVGPATDVGGTP